MVGGRDDGHLRFVEKLEEQIRIPVIEVPYVTELSGRPKPSFHMIYALQRDARGELVRAGYDQYVYRYEGWE